MKSRSFQILINVVSMLWCPLDWVSKIKTDSSGLILTLLYYTAAVTGFSAAAFTKTRFSPLYDPLSPLPPGLNSVELTQLQGAALWTICKTTKMTSK